MIPRGATRQGVCAPEPDEPARDADHEFLESCWLLRRSGRETGLRESRTERALALGRGVSSPPAQARGQVVELDV